VPGKNSLHDPSRFGVLVRESSRLFRRLFRVYAIRHGLSFNQYLVLREVFDVPKITQRSLSQSLGIAESTIVATVDALSRRNLIVRVRGKKDRRETNLSLTPAGRGLATRIIHFAIEINRDAVSAMTAREAHLLRDLLMRSNASLSESLLERETALKRNAARRK
jgi:DNA-binding MarR family transcriptional regulator